MANIRLIDDVFECIGTLSLVVMIHVLDARIFIGKPIVSYTLQLHYGMLGVTLKQTNIK